MIRFVTAHQFALGFGFRFRFWFRFLFVLFVSATLSTFIFLFFQLFEDLVLPNPSCSDRFLLQLLRFAAFRLISFNTATTSFSIQYFLMKEAKQSSSICSKQAGLQWNESMIWFLPSPVLNRTQGLLCRMIRLQLWQVPLFPLASIGFRKDQPLGHRPVVFREPELLFAGLFNLTVVLSDSLSPAFFLWPDLAPSNDLNRSLMSVCRETCLGLGSSTVGRGGLAGD